MRTLERRATAMIASIALDKDLPREDTLKHPYLTCLRRTPCRSGRDGMWKEAPLRQGKDPETHVGAAGFGS